MTDAVGWPQGWGLHALEQVDSTMLEAARIAPRAQGPVWITARQQTAARGRRGRAWAMPSGNLAATLLLPVSDPPARAALRSFVAALALSDAFIALTGRPDAFALKWPNDVLLNGGKVAGILLESLPDGWLSIGIGVNLAAAPPVAAVEPRAVRPVSLAGELGLAPAPDDLLAELAAAFAYWEGRMSVEGFAPLRSTWLARAARLGQEITDRTGNDSVTGRFETLDEDGLLILATPGGRRAIAAAEVFFPAA